MLNFILYQQRELTFSVMTLTPYIPLISHSRDWSTEKHTKRETFNLRSNRGILWKFHVLFLPSIRYLCAKFHLDPFSGSDYIVMTLTSTSSLAFPPLIYIQKNTQKNGKLLIQEWMEGSCSNLTCPLSRPSVIYVPSYILIQTGEVTI